MLSNLALTLSYFRKYFSWGTSSKAWVELEETDMFSQSKPIRRKRAMTI